MAIVCAAVLVAGVVAINLALLGGNKKDGDKDAKKTSLAIDLSSIGESGTPAELMAAYGLDAAHIVEAAKKAIARK